MSCRDICQYSNKLLHDIALIADAPVSRHSAPTDGLAPTSSRSTAPRASAHMWVKAYSDSSEILYSPTTPRPPIQSPTKRLSVLKKYCDLV